MNTIIKQAKITITLTALLQLGLHSKAQTNNLVPDTPPTPQAVAFNRLGDYQVNNNYGAPDISIPLFEIDFHGYKIPLALHYEASPMKPGYNYDVTGLGWTLSGNSCVSRTIKDRADEDGGYFNTPFVLDSFSDNSGKPRKYTEYSSNLDKLNLQYDSYNIVLPSGRTIPFFMYKSGGTMQFKKMALDSNVKIDCSYGDKIINSFTVTDENGTIYQFANAERATNGYDNDVNAERNVTWLLSSIVIPSKGTINYEYYPEIEIHSQNIIEEPTLRVSRLMSQMWEDRFKPSLDVQKTLQSQCPRYRMMLIKSISYGPTKVEFKYNSDKLHLSQILVVDQNETIKKFTLDINSSFLTSLVITGQNENDKLVYGFGYKNQKLDNNDTRVKYTDYWGNICYSNRNKDIGNFNMFFNRREYESIFLNKEELRQQLAQKNFVQLIDNKEDDPYYYYKIKLQSTTEGESRQPTSPEFHGVLSRITYPNGGYTDFTFENHRFLTASGADGDIVFDRRNQRIVEGGGFRIKSIINYTAEGKIASEDHYRYGYTYGDIEQSNLQFPLPATYNKKEHIGCGEAVVDPNLLTFMTYSYYDLKKESYRTYNGFRDMIVGIENNFETNIIDIKGKATWWDAYFSANTFRGLLGGRRPIVYPEITVYHGNPDDLTKCISKSVYKYDIYSTHHDQYTHYLLSFDKAVKPYMAYFERIYYVGDVPGLICDDSEAAKRNRLESKSDFSYNAISNSWDLVSEEEYSYINESISESGNVFNSSLSRECRTSYAGELDNKQWLDGVSLQSLYQQVTQYFGRSTMTGKSVTTLRKGGTRTYGNTLTENYSYLYSGVMSSRSYTDVYDKVDSYSFVGQDDDGTNPIITEMKSRNMLASLITAETWPEDIPSVVSGSKIDYASYGGRILPSRIYERNGDNYESSIEVISYDSYGNPTEIVDLKTGNKDNGIHSVFVWDTYGRYLIALIKNAKLSQVQSATSQLSTGTSQSRFNTLKSLLPNAQIQTWAYKPLIGVTSHTDINGQTLLYEYDGLGRLKAVKRVVNGSTAPEIINEYEYNYKNTSL